MAPDVGADGPEGLESFETEHEVGLVARIRHGKPGSQGVAAGVEDRGMDVIGGRVGRGRGWQPELRERLLVAAPEPGDGLEAWSELEPSLPQPVVVHAGRHRLRAARLDFGEGGCVGRRACRLGKRGAKCSRRVTRPGGLSSVRPFG